MGWDSGIWCWQPNSACALVSAPNQLFCPESSTGGMLGKPGLFFQFLLGKQDLMSYNEGEEGSASSHIQALHR